MTCSHRRCRQLRTRDRERRTIRTNGCQHRREPLSTLKQLAMGRSRVLSLLLWFALVVVAAGALSATSQTRVDTTWSMPTARARPLRGIDGAGLSGAQARSSSGSVGEGAEAGIVPRLSPPLAAATATTFASTPTRRCDGVSAERAGASSAPGASRTRVAHEPSSRSLQRGRTDRLDRGSRIAANSRFATEAAETPIYRGVGGDHHAIDAAREGTALPGDAAGHAHPGMHNRGLTESSRLTSRTTDELVAGRFAGANGVVLETTIEELQRRGIQILASPVSVTSEN